jgi:3-phosphoshikimate 1-carboxyvinyltransferase
MKLRVTKSSLTGQVPIPGSKSHTIRCVALAALAEGTSEIIAPLSSADTFAAVKAYCLLGAQIECEATWKVKGTAGQLCAPDKMIDVANSGTTLRFATGSAALIQEGICHLTGDQQVCSRPIGPLLKSLNDLGANCLAVLENGKAPLTIQGTLKGGETSIAAVTSQYLSSLLVNTPLAPNDSLIRVTQLNEQPYVEITLAYLDEMGIKYKNDQFKQFIVKGGQSYRPFSKRVPADFSSATFFLCAAAFLDADLTLEGLDFNDPQGDKAVVEILRQMGAQIEINAAQVRARPGQLRGIEIDMNAIPDALPALAVTACFAKGPTRIYNVAQARLKETDRIAVMTRELTKLGANITEAPDGMTIVPAKLTATDLHGHHDHRVVMALSLAAMALQGECTIDTAEAMNVTFPNFVELMQSVGANMQCMD